MSLFFSPKHHWRPMIKVYMVPVIFANVELGLILLFNVLDMLKSVKTKVDLMPITCIAVFVSSFILILAYLSTLFYRSSRLVIHNIPGLMREVGSYAVLLWHFDLCGHDIHNIAMYKRYLLNFLYLIALSVITS